ncbi:hypothetical protein [Deinococcus frigens]|uniref:hypothetical protein n=1 Tax=Deinococcus frigens TaxID=249403 RepID=UPI00049636A6|nr:hypothetical protein [Deinococcus frigens]
MTARRLAKVEAAAGVGRTAWQHEARRGLALALEAVGLCGGDVGSVEAVRVAFAVFHSAYRPGAGRRDMEAAAEVTLYQLWAVLDGPTFEMVLSVMVVREASRLPTAQGRVQ